MDIKLIGIEGEELKFLNSPTIEFHKPFLIHDNLKAKEAKPEVQIISPPFSMDHFPTTVSLYAVALKPGQTWAKRQKYRYYIRSTGVPSDEGSKKINKLPLNHYLEVDEANGKVRLIGDKISSLTNKTEWLYY